MNYKIVTSQSITIQGIEIRTNNARMHELVAHWQKFLSENVLLQIEQRISDEIIVGYFDYESDYTGDYTYLIGCEVPADAAEISGLVKRTIESGAYAIIPAEGQMPDVLGAAWYNIWNSSFDRAYKTDFERYKSPTQVDVYIGLKK